MHPSSDGRNTDFILQLAKSACVQHYTAAGTCVAAQICVVGKLLSSKLVDRCLQFSTILFYLLEV
jgi:hypothetical protein